MCPLLFMVFVLFGHYEVAAPFAHVNVVMILSDQIAGLVKLGRDL